MVESSPNSGTWGREHIRPEEGGIRMGKEPFLVLMAEDDEHDIVATRRAWNKHHITNPLHIVNDGEQCLDFLYRRGKYKDRATSPQLGILLLDIKMPRMDGLAVLKYIRNDGHLRCLPVIILSTSIDEEDRLNSYDLGANAYVVKPVGFEKYAEAVRAISHFWQLAELPVGDHGTDHSNITTSHAN
jgi:CheY-like chemotaxis protein